MPRRRRHRQPKPTPASLPAPAPTPVDPPWRKGPCGCRNHLGKPKVKYRTRDAALDAIMRRYSRLAVAASAYPCPHGFGCFHVRTEKRVK